MISKRIMETDSFKNGIFYRASCECGSKDCDMSIEIEHDPELKHMLFLNIYRDLHWSSYWANPDNWWNRLKKRISGTARMLFKGRVEMESTFILSGKKQVEEFIKALKEGILRLEGYPK
jgi:hypothetical protein